MPDDKSKDPQSRAYNLAQKKSVKDDLLKLYDHVLKGFQDQQERSRDIEDYWDIYNCVLGWQQSYNGNAAIFVPIVKNAIIARGTRFCNQIFPPTGRYVDVVSSDGTMPNAIMALDEHYVRKAKLRQQVMPALLANGDVEGHYSIYVSWDTRSRWVTKRTMQPPNDEDGGEYEDVEEEEIVAACPTVEVLADSDLLVLPNTVDSLEEAIESGGSVTVLRRWTKGKVERMMREGEIDKKQGKALIEEMSGEKKDNLVDKGKDMVKAAGIKSSSRGKHVLVYETWSLVEGPGWNKPRLCRTYFGGKDKVLSCVRNPLWCDRLPIISCPVRKSQGAFKGRSLVADVASLQWYANDVMNEAADSSQYALLPIVMTDPEKNPRVGSMVMNLAAVWLTNPNDTQFAKFPDLWKDGLAIVADVTQTIMQTLSVNPAMITALNQKKKQSQADVANEHQIDALTTADSVGVMETGILTPMLVLFNELDYQFRDQEVMIRAYGELGQRAEMETIQPQQSEHRYEFKWFGVEQARAMQMVQQQVAFANVLKGIPAQMIPGYRINLAPLLVQAASNIYGPRLAPLVLEDVRAQIEIPVKQEVELALQGVETPVHPMDNHAQHLQALMEALKTVPPNAPVRNTVIAQILKRQMFLMQIQQQQMQLQQPQQGQPGPRQGAVPAQQRPAQQPPGAIHQDQMSQTDPSAMPRNM